MPGIKRFVKLKIFPRPHNRADSFGASLESGTVNYHTIMPIAMYDEGLGSPSTYEANPEHASFVEAAEPNVFPESKIDMLFAQCTVSMTRLALETDKVHAITFGVMPIHVSFLEDLTANDELSTLNIAEILELDSETTDRQCYPLWNDLDCDEPYTGAGLLPTNVPSLDTTQAIEGVAFNETQFYDCLHYYQNGGKMKVCQSGLKWYTITKQHPVKKINFRLPSKTKFANPYMFYGILITVPQAGTPRQYAIVGDTTADAVHLRFDFRYRFNEWNDQFNMKRV